MMLDDVRGYNSYMPGNCILCSCPLGSVRDITKIPIFDPFNDPETAELGVYINQYVHRDCWCLWESRDLIAKAVIEQNTEFVGAKQFVKDEHVAAWGFERDSIEFSHGCILLPRSSLIFKNTMDYDVTDCQIRGRTANITFLLDTIKSGKLLPNTLVQQPQGYGLPDMDIECFDYFDDYLEVLITSAHRYGMNYSCFIFKDDIDSIRNLY